MVNISGFKEGSLSVKYLGVPLITGSLKAIDCQVLVDKITARIQTWRAKSLSYAAVQQLCTKFLWGTTEAGSANSKVAWDKLSCPKKE
ncbi:hypothetical protein LINPERHAP2_LOCUS43426, partial [Linum perenne]